MSSINAGIPNPVQLLEISDPTAVTDTGFLYTNDVGAITELMYTDSDGTEVQITSAGGLAGGSMFWPDDTPIKLGNVIATPDVQIQWETADADAHYLSVAIGSVSRNIIISEDVGVDWGHAAQTNPTLWIHSADATDLTDWISLAHNQTNAVVNWGNGSLSLAGGAVAVTGALSAGGVVTISAAAPSIDIKDTDASAGDINAQILVAATDVGDGTEDVDVTLLQQIAGTLTAFLTSDADGNITLGSGRPLVADGGGSLTGTWSDLGSVTTVDLNGGSIDGVTIGAAAAGAITGTTIDATTDFTIGGTVITDGLLTDPDFILTQSAGTTGSTGFTFNTGAHTGITAATERLGLDFAAVTKTWALGAGPLATQREVLLRAPTYVGNVGGALTITNAATLAITGAPVQGANMTLSATHALWVQAGNTQLDGTVTATGGGSLTGTWSDLGAVTTVDINGGTIDGVTIGGAVPGAITGTTITATSIVIGANTLDTTEWAFLDGQNQAVASTSSPTFVNLSITSMAANWTNAGRTVADAGILTTVDINGGSVDGTTIGAAAASTIVGTTIDATTDFTIGGTVLTDGVITDTGILVLTPTSAVSLGSGEAGTVAATGMMLRGPDITTGGLGNIAGTDLSDGPGVGTGTGDAGRRIFELPIVAAAGDFLQTRAERLALDMAASTTVLTMQAAQAMTINVAAGDLTLSGVAGSDVLIGDDATLLYVDGGVNGGIGGVGIGQIAQNGSMLVAGWNAYTMAAGTTAARHIYTQGNVTELAGAAITDIVGAYFNTFTVVDGGAAETVGILSTVYIPNAPTQGSAPTNGPYAFFVDDGTTRLDGILQQNNAIYFTQTDGNERIDSAADGYLDFTSTTAHRFNMSAADTDVRLEFVGTTSSGLLEWMEDEDQFRFGDNLSATFINYGEVVNAIGSIGGGAQAIDLTLGNVVTGTVDTSETTFSFTNPKASGTASSFTLILTNGGSQTVNWPASVDWAGASAPTLTAAGVDILTFVTVDGGTIWYGFSSGLNMG